MPQIVPENEDRIVTEIDTVSFQGTYNLGRKDKQIMQQEATLKISAGKCNLKQQDHASLVVVYVFNPSIEAKGGESL